MLCVLCPLVEQPVQTPRAFWHTASTLHPGGSATGATGLDRGPTAPPRVPGPCDGWLGHPMLCLSHTTASMPAAQEHRGGWEWQTAVLQCCTRCSIQSSSNLGTLACPRHTSVGWGTRSLGLGMRCAARGRGLTGSSSSRGLCRMLASGVMCRDAPESSTHRVRVLRAVKAHSVALLLCCSSESATPHRHELTCAAPKMQPSSCMLQDAAAAAALP